MIGLARLAWWLGPWSPRDRGPGVERRGLTLRPGAPESYLYLPHGRPAGAWLLSPGVHWLGPADPRMDRLARTLASTGYAVLSPAVPDLMDLRLTPRVVDDLLAAHDALRDATGARPAVFSVSLGSLAALRVAAARDVAGLFLFGAAVDPGALIRSFIVAPRDPLNQPLAFLTLAPRLPIDARSAESVTDAWREQVRRTWTRPELKVAGGTSHCASALAIAAGLPTKARDIFLIGCGARPGGWDLCSAALVAPEFEFLDPRPWMARVRCPVHVAHAVDDDVVPFEQRQAVSDALPPGVPVRLYATGLYRHSAPAGGPGVLSRLSREAASTARMLRAIETCPRAGALG